MNAATIDKEHLPIFRKAGLLATGTLELRGYRSNEVYDSVKIPEDGSSNVAVISKSKTARFDYTRIPCYTSPAADDQGRVRGCWTHGLTAKEIEVIKSYNVPVFFVDQLLENDRGGKYKGDSELVLQHGRFFDLSDPAQMAEVKVLMHVSLVAEKPEEASEVSPYYFHVIGQEKERAKESMKTERSAFELVWNTDIKPIVWKQVLTIIAREHRKVINLRDEEAYQFILQDIAKENPRAILEAYHRPTRQHYAKAYSYIMAGALYGETEDGPFYINSGSSENREMVAKTMAELVKLVSNPNQDKIIRIEKLMEQIEDMSKQSKVRQEKHVLSLLDRFLVTDEDLEEEERVIIKFPKSQLPRASKNTLMGYLTTHNLTDLIKEDIALDDLRQLFIDNQLVE